MNYLGLASTSHTLLEIRTEICCIPTLWPRCWTLPTSPRICQQFFAFSSPNPLEVSLHAFLHQLPSFGHKNVANTKTKGLTSHDSCFLKLAVLLFQRSACHISVIVCYHISVRQFYNGRSITCGSRISSYRTLSKQIVLCAQADSMYVVMTKN